MTLLEIVFIMAILGILLAIGTPNLLRQMQRMKLEQAISQTVGFMQSARLRAVRDRATYTVSFDKAEDLIQGVGSGLPGDGDQRNSLDLDNYGLDFYFTGYTGLPAGLDPDCPEPPVAGISYSSTGVAVGVPIEFCITDLSGNIMKITVESIGGQPRVRKFIAEKDPHGRYPDRTAGFYLQSEDVPWYWY